MTLAVFAGGSARAWILNEAGRAGVAQIKPRYRDVLIDVSRMAERTDLPSADRDCVREALRLLVQMSEELRGYESLMTIEGQLVDAGEDDSLKTVIRFAVANAIKILDIEQRRLGELSDQCAPLPLASGKIRQALQFVESTATILRSVQPQL